MSGLIAKDLLVFKKRFNWLYRAASVIMLVAVFAMFPGEEGMSYVAMLLPALGVAFLTELINVEEKSDWRDYLPVLPVTGREIVLSRYLFCGLLLGGFALVSLVLCAAGALAGMYSLRSVMPDYVLGLLFAVLILCFGIPGGYRFNNRVCTGVMILACTFFNVFHNTGAEATFLGLGGPAMAVILSAGVPLALGASYLASMAVYRAERRRTVKPAASKL